MNAPFYINSIRHISPANQAVAIVGSPREIQEVATQTKTVPRMWAVAGCATEVVVAVFAVFYVVAALSLGGALLFFTIWR